QSSHFQTQNHTSRLSILEIPSCIVTPYKLLEASEIKESL
ncbi:unnamed protein product, partial [marine sediment metagenome]